MKPLRDDPELSRLIEEHGELELERSDKPFRRLVTSIINQQLSTQSAAAIKERLFENQERRGTVYRGRPERGEVRSDER